MKDLFSFVRFHFAKAEEPEPLSPSEVQFSPMNINFGLIPQLGYRVKGKRNKNAEISRRALEELDKLDLS